MEWVSTWWSGLVLTEQVLFCIAIPATLILIIQAVLILVGAGDDGAGGDFDGGDASGSAEFGVASLFTLQGVASFFCVFGWVAISMFRTGFPLIFAALVAAILGFVTMFAIAKLMIQISKLAHTGNLDINNLVGCSGTVYLRIPPKGEGKGKVMVQTSERLVEFNAVSETDEEIPNNAQIKVIDILGENVLKVERSDKLATLQS